MSVGKRVGAPVSADQVQDFVETPSMVNRTNEVVRYQTYTEVMTAYQEGKLKPGPPQHRVQLALNTQGKLLAARRQLVVTTRYLRGLETQIENLEKELVEEARGNKPSVREIPQNMVAHDLCGLVIGPFKVVGYLAASNTTPWWLASCLRCKVKDAYRGNALRAAAKGTRGIACRACNALGTGLRDPIKAK